jgi:hypothetical protein
LDYSPTASVKTKCSPVKDDDKFLSLDKT